jgi:hypothetical protein
MQATPSSFEEGEGEDQDLDNHLTIWSRRRQRNESRRVPRGGKRPSARRAALEEQREKRVEKKKELLRDGPSSIRELDGPRFSLTPVERARLWKRVRCKESSDSEMEGDGGGPDAACALKVECNCPTGCGCSTVYFGLPLKTLPLKKRRVVFTDSE